MTATALYDRLHQDGFQPWMDKKDLLPGQEWEHEIKRAGRNAHAFLVCVSHHSATRAGFINREIRFALDVVEEQPEGTIFIIPVRLEDTAVPERVQRWHWCNYFEEEGYDLLVRALRKRAEQVGAVIEPPPLPRQETPIQPIPTEQEAPPSQTSIVHTILFVVGMFVAGAIGMKIGLFIGGGWIIGMVFGFGGVVGLFIGGYIGMLIGGEDGMGIGVVIGAYFGWLIGVVIGEKLLR
ncbi:MAG: TIR domain-containing protein [Chloroflexaceae bacterium]|nr:TIR domain-containing protein [Chloroflexaceae bacterium]